MELHSQEEAEEVITAVSQGAWSVSKVKRQEKNRQPAPPFTTSTLQQEASRKLNMSLGVLGAALSLELPGLSGAVSGAIPLADKSPGGGNRLVRQAQRIGTHRRRRAKDLSPA